MLRTSTSKAHQSSHSVIRVPQETDKQTRGLVAVPIMQCLGSGGQPTHASCMPKEDVYASMTRQRRSRRGSSSGCLRHSWRVDWHVPRNDKVPGPAVARHAGYELLDTR